MHLNPIKKIKESLSFRLAFFYSISLTAFLLVAFCLTYFLIKNKLEQSDKEIISAKMSEMSSILSTSEIKGLGGYLALEKKRILNAPFLIRVTTKEGEALFVKPAVQEQIFDFEKLFTDSKAGKPLDGWYRYSAINDEDVFDILVHTVSENYILEIGKSSDSREDTLDEIFYIFGASGLVFIFLSSFVGLYYAKRSLLPIRNLIAAIKFIEMGDFSKRVIANKSNDELSELSAAFNRMIAKIETLILMMKESLDNVAK